MLFCGSKETELGADTPPPTNHDELYLAERRPQGGAHRTE